MYSFQVVKKSDKNHPILISISKVLSYDEGRKGEVKRKEKKLTHGKYSIEANSFLSFPSEGRIVTLLIKLTKCKGEIVLTVICYLKYPTYTSIIITSFSSYLSSKNSAI